MVSLYIGILVASMVVISDAGQCLLQEIIERIEKLEENICGESPSYLGCFVDTHDRILNGFEKKGDSHMTVTKCISICKERMFPYAGVQFSTECFCGDRNTSAKRPESECNMPCSGDRSKICGGSWRNSVYSVK